jgi:hypothetical protein
MATPTSSGHTPVYVKDRADMLWPEEDKIFYLLAANGLFRCRNHPFFRSSVPAPEGPSELLEQATFLEPRYPLISRHRFEHVVGFFARIALLHGSEAAVLLAWDRTAQRIRVIVPEQVATVSRNWWGDVFPIGLHYEIPADLPRDWILLGDIHSHVNGAAYASATDREDETHRAGLHIVVGRLNREPPEIHIAAVVDGTRFRVRPDVVLEGYERRRMRVPLSWIGRVQVEPSGSAYRGKTSTPIRGPAPAASGDLSRPSEDELPRPLPSPPANGESAEPGIKP